MKKFRDIDIDLIDDIIVKSGRVRAKIPRDDVEKMKETLKWAIDAKPLLEWYEHTYGKPKPKEEEKELLQARNRARNFFSRLMKR